MLGFFEIDMWGLGALTFLTAQMTVQAFENLVAEHLEIPDSDAEGSENPESESMEADVVMFF